ncbi:tetrahydromethanopterin S-methyltransferase subunit F [Rhodococcus sp. LBL1]|nr:tetrahydromethanopterin S-methyltransferase subunit F [Rhodococcus sp. LBL1]MDH6685806.1 tetrahydromethanopterin S-methyltransferase subunit F [Rhodococcus sp. LBL2]
MLQDGLVSESTPRVVSIAYWIWVLCAAVMVLLGLLAMTTSADAIREQLGADADSFVWLLRGIGATSLLFGLAIGFLAAPTRAGSPRLRLVVVVLSSIFALVTIGLSAIGLIAPVLLVIPLLLVVASVLVFREGAREWFRRGQSD